MRLDAEAIKLGTESRLRRNELRDQILDGDLCGLADDGLAKIRRPHLDLANAGATPFSATTTEHQTAALGDTLAACARHDLARRGVDEARRDPHGCLTLGRADFPEAKTAS